MPRIARILVALLIALTPASTFATAPAQPSALPAGWGYFEQFRITDTSGSGGTNVNVSLTIDTAALIAAGEMLTDGSDIRVSLDADGTQWIPHWFGTDINTAATTVWVQLPTLPANGIVDIYVFYGNPTAASTSTLSALEGPFSSTDSYPISNAGGVTNSQRGFRFAPKQDVLVTSFGKREPNGTTRYVTLFNGSTQAIVHQQQISGPAGQFSYASIPQPLWLTAGQQYLLMLYQGSSDGYYYEVSSQVNARLTYYDMRYCNSCTQNTFPTSYLNSMHYGLPDFEFYAPKLLTPAPSVALVDHVDLYATITDGSTTAVPGTPHTYTVVVGNRGPDSATGAGLVVEMPATLANITYTSVAAGGASGNSPSGVGEPADVLTLPGGSSVTYTVQGTIDPAASNTLLASAAIGLPANGQESTPADNSTTDSDVLEPHADLQASLVFSGGSAIPGTVVSLTLTIVNNGPSVASGAQLSASLPSSLNGVRFTSTATGGAAGNTETGTGAPADQLSLPPGGTVEYQVLADILADASGNLEVSGAITVPLGATDPSPTNNSALASKPLQPQGDLIASIAANPAPAIPGLPITYTVTLTNLGPSTAFNAPLGVSLPPALANLRFTSVSTGGASGNTANGAGAPADQLTLPPGATVEYQVVAAVAADADAALVASAAIGAPGGLIDTTPANNAAGLSTPLHPEGDLAVTIAANPAVAMFGWPIIYTVTLTNHGPSTATNATFTLSLPPLLTNVGFTSTSTGGASGNIANGTGVPAGQLTLPPGATVEYRVVADVPADAAGTLVASATITPPAGATDPALANNSATATTTAGVIVVAIDQVSPAVRTTPVSEVVVTFSAPIDLATFDRTDLSLTRDGEALVIDERVAISALGNNRYRIANLETLTAPQGAYRLTVAGANIKTAGGATIIGTQSVGWVVQEDEVYWAFLPLVVR